MTPAEAIALLRELRSKTVTDGASHDRIALAITVLESLIPKPKAD
jgi:hypothetical protein